MDFLRGMVVRASAGRDKGGFFTVLEAGTRGVAICDGKRRPLEHPKWKNEKHLCPTVTLLPESSLQTNREIRRALSGYPKGPFST